MSVVITPNVHHTNPYYFMPRFVKVGYGKTITWFNQDKRDHHLIFDNEIMPYGSEIGTIKTGESISKTFDVYNSRIDYRCSMHPEERGTIVIYSKEEQ